MASDKVLQRGQFSKLLGCIKLLENCCTDCDISEGFIRQKTNDRQAIIEMDLTSILDANDLSLSLIKQKVMLLRTFELDDNVKVPDENIVIRTEEQSYKFIDPLSKMTFRKPMKKFLDNSYIPADKFAEMITCKEEDLVFNVTASAYICKRIKAICEGFQTNSIKCEMNQLAGLLRISTVDNTNTSEVVTISLNTEMPNSYFNMISLPFSLELNSDIKLNVYKTSGKVLLCKFDQKFFGIPMTIFTRVSLMTEA